MNVSVIVPVYNTRKYLKRCVESLTGQTCPVLEILLVDDGSVDGSGRVCDEFAQSDTRVRVIHKENGGLVSAWKRGVTESTGEYLCFVDSDDWVDLNMIGEMSAFLTGNPKEIIAGDYVIERGEGRRQYIWQELSPGEYDRKAIENEVIPSLLGKERRHVTISRCMKLISRKLIEDNMKYSDPKVVMGEDMTVMLPALTDCRRLVIMDHKAYYHYLYVQESMVHKYDKNLYENIQLLRRIIHQVVEDKFSGPVFEEQKKKADQEYIFLLLLVLKNEARGNPKGYCGNILKICRSEEIKDLVANTPVKVEQRANKLLYLTLRHPNRVTVRLLRLAMILCYARRAQ